MTTLLAPNEITTGESGWSPDEAQLAAAAFLARYSGLSRAHTASDLRGSRRGAVSHRRVSDRGGSGRPLTPWLLPA